MMSVGQFHCPKLYLRVALCQDTTDWIVLCQAEWDSFIDMNTQQEIICLENITLIR